jgi:hypothetical protein
MVLLLMQFVLATPVQALAMHLSRAERPLQLLRNAAQPARQASRLGLTACQPPHARVQGHGALSLEAVRK